MAETAPFISVSELHCFIICTQHPSLWGSSLSTSILLILVLFFLAVGQKCRSFHKEQFSSGKRKELFIFRLFKPIWTRTADSRCLSPIPDAYERLNPVNDCMVPMGECRIVGKGQDCIQAEHNKCWLSRGKCYFLYCTHANAFTDTWNVFQASPFLLLKPSCNLIDGKWINKWLSGNEERSTQLTFYPWVGFQLHYHCLIP